MYSLENNDMLTEKSYPMHALNNHWSQIIIQRYYLPKSYKYNLSSLDANVDVCECL